MFLLMKSQTEIITSQILFQNTFILTGPRKAIFADIIKIMTKFIKNIFKDSQKGKIIRNNLPNYNRYLYLLI